MFFLRFGTHLNNRWVVKFQEFQFLILIKMKRWWKLILFISSINLFLAKALFKFEGVLVQINYSGVGGFLSNLNRTRVCGRCIVERSNPAWGQRPQLWVGQLAASLWISCLVVVASSGILLWVSGLPPSLCGTQHTPFSSGLVLKTWTGRPSLWNSLSVV